MTCFVPPAAGALGAPYLGRGAGRRAFAGGAMGGPRGRGAPLPGGGTGARNPPMPEAVSLGAAWAIP